MHTIEALLVPQKTVGRKVRYGPWEDTGYVVIDGVIDSVKPLISFGAGDNIDFELEVGMKLRAPVVCCDEQPQERFYWRYPALRSAPIGSEHRLAETVTFRRVHATRENIAGILPRTGSYILKMDIEGAEWDVIRGIPPEMMQRMDMLVIEYHLGLEHRTRGTLDALEDVLLKVNCSHSLVHVHANNYEPMYVNGTRLPSVLECCYVSRATRLARSEIDLGEYPVLGIDAPNNPHARDMPLDWWKAGR